MLKFIDEIKDKNIAILAFKREGVATLKYIRKYLPDKLITILDKDSNLVNNDIIKTDKNLNYVFGDNYLDDLDRFDLIIKSPGVSLHNIDTSLIKDKIRGEVDILLDYYSQNVIGITGTKGKSTTSSLLYKVLKDNGFDVYLCGNIGVPVFNYLDDIKKDTILVVEMSAYQTEYLRCSPHISILLNLYEEHLDYFKTLDNYYNSKLNILRFQKDGDYFLYSYDNDNINRLIKNIDIKSNPVKISMHKNNSGIYLDNDNIYFDSKYLCDKNMKRNIVGEHNLNNIMFVLGVCDILNIDIKDSLKSIERFEPLPHRLEYVGKYKDILFYNDSISTIPEASINGVNTIGNVDSLIIGGKDRGIDYSSLINFLNNSSVSNIICLKDTGWIIGKEIKGKNVYFANSMENAVSIAYSITKKGYSVLLSPAAPSYNMYKNFEERGNDFKNLVLKKEFKKH